MHHNREMQSLMNYYSIANLIKVIKILIGTILIKVRSRILCHFDCVRELLTHFLKFWIFGNTVKSRYNEWYIVRPVRYTEKFVISRCFFSYLFYWKLKKTFTSIHKKLIEEPLVQFFLHFGIFPLTEWLTIFRAIVCVFQIWENFIFHFL